ncbi:hypothetical protein E2562_020716 [Oryza meyeriana var. granulata]|uniref:Uncharacterized protein n=1 Tax=Oryza meyeriana var. granulata TaxID=110450 RepID=A0A6G1EN33_9ORYZ|nr:hypothetical protein E2562_020716 [Oryza meyeriana var. granulata]
MIDCLGSDERVGDMGVLYLYMYTSLSGLSSLLHREHALKKLQGRPAPVIHWRQRPDHQLEDDVPCARLAVLQLVLLCKDDLQPADV